MAKISNPKIVVIFVDTDGLGINEDTEEYIKKKAGALQEQLGDSYKVIGVDKNDKVKFIDDDNDVLTCPTYPSYPTIPNPYVTEPNPFQPTWVITCTTSTGQTAVREEIKED